MGLRPARTCRTPLGQPWARVSQATPRKSFVKGAPRPRVRQYVMGADKAYELEMDLVADVDVRLRDNALEAARQIANKFLEKNLPLNYYFQLLKYPHYVIREHAALGVAGSDRISKGMKLAFGRPKGRGAGVKKGEPVFRARFMKEDLPIIREALKRAQTKLSGSFKMVSRDISKEEWNIAKGTVAKAFKVKEEEVPKPEAAPSPVPGAPPAGAPTPAMPGLRPEAPAAKPAKT